MRVALSPVVLVVAIVVAGCGSGSDKSATPTRAKAVSTQAEPKAKPPPRVTTAARTTSTTTTEAAPPPTAATPTTTIAVTQPTPPATSKTPTPSSPVTEQSVCPSEQRAGIVAVFGHRPTREAALALATEAEQRGFTGLSIQQRGCRDFAAVLPFLKTYKQALEFRKEAIPEGFKVQIECRSHPVEGGLAAVFGHRRTRVQAEALLRQATKVGFRNLQLQRDRCNDWEVDLYGIMTAAARAEFKAEAHRAGFRIVYELG